MTDKFWVRPGLIPDYDNFTQIILDSARVRKSECLENLKAECGSCVCSLGEHSTACRVFEQLKVGI